MVSFLRQRQDTQSYFQKQALLYEISELISYLAKVCHVHIFPGERSYLVCQILPRSFSKLVPLFFSFYEYQNMAYLIVL